MRSFLRPSGRRATGVQGPGTANLRPAVGCEWTGALSRIRVCWRACVSGSMSDAHKEGIQPVAHALLPNSAFGVLARDFAVFDSLVLPPPIK